MATTQTTALSVDAREAAGSRAARRLRRAGNVPGVLYGGGEDPVAFQVDARLLRNTLAHAGAVLELSIAGAGGTPVVVKELVRHPVSGDMMHIDLLRVRLDQAIGATVVLDLVGGEDAPGVKEGGVLEQVTRELNIEALPTDIPERISVDVSGMDINGVMNLSEVAAPAGVVFLDDPDETVIATITVPTQVAEPEIEEETELVGEEGAPAEPEAEAEGGDEAAAAEGGEES